MNVINHLAKKLNEFINLEDKIDREIIASYVVGELIGDYDGLYIGLMESSVTVNGIADLASDLEWSNGSKNELDAMWIELKRLIEKLYDESVGMSK